MNRYLRRGLLLAGLFGWCVSINIVGQSLDEIEGNTFEWSVVFGLSIVELLAVCGFVAFIEWLGKRRRRKQREAWAEEDRIRREETEEEE